MSTLTVHEALNRNGVIIERARRASRSLSRIERIIIAAGRKLAEEKNLIRYRMNSMEMEGERNWEEVLTPLKVVAVFAYYDDPYEDIPAHPSYVIRESNHPGLPEGGHVCPAQLIEAGVPIPKTPTFKKWVTGGRKVVRS